MLGLIIRNLTKRYGSHVILRDINLNIEDGEFICIIGPSGCGKTTLLRILEGFEDYDGEILQDGEPIRSPSTKRFMVFQDLNQLLPWKTVRGNILFGEMSSGFIEKYSVDYLISLVKLEGFEEYYPHQISGGMKQRVAIARALYMNPLILLMDEPFGSLDAHTRRKLRVELMNIWDEVKKTVVFVTHNINESILLADRLIVLSSKGEVKADIPIELNRPRDITSHEFGLYWKKILSLLEVTGVR